MKSLGRENMRSMASKTNKKKKISKNTTKQQKKKSRSSDVSIFSGEITGIVCEILSRLPVKALMRFKCVCKGWLSLIQDDSYFVDLHLNQSKKRPCFTLAIPRKRRVHHPQGTCCIDERPNKAEMLTADLSETVSIAAGATPVIHNVRKTVSPVYYCGVLKPVNGLICFTDTTSLFGVCIYNLSTRELSPWIRTTFPIKKRRFYEYQPTYGFGYDPSTKEHKVICMWNDEDSDSAYIGSEVMTVGDNTWRIIDEVPQYDLEKSSVYANGSIYWITGDLVPDMRESKVLIVAFDVGSEKFKTIALPKFITNQFAEDFLDVTRLLEVNDHVALSYILPHGNVAKLWILDDKNITTNWREVSLELPFPWDKKQWVQFHGIAGTDQILLKNFNDGKDKNLFSLYSYNWESKAFTEVKTGKLYSSIRSSFTTLSRFYEGEALCDTFTESLLSVRKT